MEDCTRHTVRPGPASLPHHGQESGGTRDPQDTAQSRSPCTAGGAPPCQARMLTPQRGAAQHSKILTGAGTWGASCEYTRNNATTDKRMAPRGVHTPTARPLGPPPVRVRPDTAPRKGMQKPDEPRTHIPAGPAGGAKEVYIRRPSAQVTFRTVFHWDRVRRAK